MRRKEFLFLFLLQLVFLSFFLLTTIIYFVSKNMGYDGITIRLFGGEDDGFFYWNQALIVANDGEAILTSIYPLLIGYLVKFIGYKDVIVIRYFNFFGFVILVFSSLYLLKLIIDCDKSMNFSVKQKKEMFYLSGIFLILILFLYPSLIMNVTLSIYRDVWIYASYIISLIFVIRIYFFKRYIYLVPATFSISILYLFREYAGVCFVLVTIIVRILNKIWLYKHKVLILSFAIITIAIYYTFFSDYKVPLLDMSLRDALQYRNLFLDRYAGGSQMGISLDQPNIILFLFNYVYSYVGNLIGPLPWHINSLGTLIVFLTESILFIYLLSFIWRNRLYLEKIHYFIMLYCFIWIGFIAISNDNIGTATRLRVVGLLPLIVVFVHLFFKKSMIKKFKQ
ncbi:hypothetical protein GS458_3195 [Geobacillus stearothermophilus]|nr:hypothetical protein GS458_3195 [Geobacillus stearothermophilus]